MNYLQLTARLKRKCRVTGSAPTVVIGAQTEEVARLGDWINEAWMDIQLSRPDWKWMRRSMSFPSVAGQATYTLAQIQSTGIGFTDFGNWDLDSFRNYTTAVGLNDEWMMGWIPYGLWRDSYQLGAIRQTRTRPNQFTVTPDLGIGLGCPPALGYTITGDYYKVATELLADTDIPALPSQFQMAIIYRAMMFYGMSEAAPEVYDEGEKEFKRMMDRIEQQQLPAMEYAGALA